jgi:DNA-binding Lrp family transcriptional regulator
MAKLTPLQQHILFLLERQSDISVRELGELLGEREHVARHALLKLEQEEFFRREVIVNQVLLGWSSFCINLSLQSKGPSAHKLLVDTLKKSPRVTWIAETGGDFQYEITILGRNELEITAFLDELPKISKTSFLKKNAYIETSFFTFGSKYLLPESLAGELPPALTNNDPGRVEHDATDHLVLWTLCNGNHKNFKDAAQKAGIPLTTFDYRVKKLEKLGVIARKVCVIDQEKCGAHMHHVYISTSCANSLIGPKLVAFCQKHRNVFAMIRTLGIHDYQLICYMLHSDTTSALIRDLESSFAEELADYRVVPVLNIHKRISFPFPKDWNEIGRLFA